MKEGLVSIITPAYNCEKYIGQTIESVISQTYQNWEMIITNDCSTDNTEQIVIEYAKQDHRIKLVKLSENSGAAIARNTGMSKAQGQYIAFLDADDLWKPKKLELQIAFMLENGYAFTFTSYQYLRETPGEKLRIIPAVYCIGYQESLGNTIIGCLSVVIDRRQVGYFEMLNVKSSEDHLTWWHIMKMGFKAYGLKINLAEYRIVKGSISRNKYRQIKMQWRLYRDYEKLSVIDSVYYFSYYMFNAIRKHWF